MSTETIAPEVVSDVTPLPELQLIVQQQALPPEIATNLYASWAPVFKEARDIIEESRKIVVTDSTQTRLMKLADVNRLALKKTRVGADKLREKLKAESLRTGNAIQGFWHIFLAMVAAEEQRLQEQVDFAAIQEANRKAALKEAREKVLLGIQVDPNLYQLADMGEETFQTLVEGTKLARAAEAERRRKEEAEKIEREAKDQAERERIRQENERLKQEAEARLKAEKEQRERERALDEKRIAIMRRFIESGDETGMVFYGAMTEEQFEAAKTGAQNRWAARVKAEEEAKTREDAQKAERARLEAEKAAVEAKARADREAAEIERKRLADEAAKEKARIETENAKKLAEQKRISDEAAAKERAARLASEAENERRIAAERRKAEAARKESEAREATLKTEQAKIQAQLQAERDAQAERERARIEAERKAAAAPDKEKLIAYANAIRAVEIPTFSTPEAQAIGTTIAASRDRFVEWCEQKGFAL